MWPVVARVEHEFVEQVRAGLGDAAYETALAEGAGQTLSEALTAAGGVRLEGGVPAGG